MSEASEPVIIGVDGGGTKTQAWLARVDAHATDQPPFTVIGRGAAGPANPASLDVGRCVEAVAQAIHSAFADAGISQRRITALAVGLAGAGQAVIAEQVRDSLQALGLADRTAITDDVSPAWRAASDDLQSRHIEPAYPAVVLASGTGAMAWGIDAKGSTARAGGLGPHLGDPGSGYAIGRAALDAGLDLPDVAAMRNPTLHTEAAPAADIAGLARTVIEHSLNTPGARAIVERAANDLCDLVCDVVTPLGGRPGGAYSLVMTGSILCRAMAVRNAVMSKLAARGYQPTTTTRIPDPVLGSLLLARDTVRHSSP